MYVLAVGALVEDYGPIFGGGVYFAFEFHGVVASWAFGGFLQFGASLVNVLVLSEYFA